MKKAFILALTALLLAGCKTIKYLPIETVKTEYVSKTDTVTKTDTVMKNKTTVIREVNKNDSALLAKYGVQIKQNERVLLYLQKELERERSRETETKHDTVIVNDTIRQPYPVEKELTAYQKLCVNLAVPVVCILLLVIILLFRKFLKV